MLGDSRYPEWAQQRGLALEEDDGGRHFKFGFYLEFKLYVFPRFKVELIKGYASPPRGYVKPTVAKKKFATKVTKSVKEEKTDIGEEKW